MASPEELKGLAHAQPPNGCLPGLQAPYGYAYPQYVSGNASLVQLQPPNLNMGLPGQPHFQALGNMNYNNQI